MIGQGPTMPVSNSRNTFATWIAALAGNVASVLFPDAAASAINFSWMPAACLSAMIA